MNCEQILTRSVCICLLGGGGFGGSGLNHTRAAIAKYHRLGGFKLIYSLTVWRPEVWDQGVSRVGFLWGPLSLACRRPPSPCVFTWLPSVLLCVWVPSSNKDSSPIGLGPTHITSCKLNDPFKDPISKYSHILRYQGLGRQNINLGETQFSPKQGKYKVWRNQIGVCGILWKQSQMVT